MRRNCRCGLPEQKEAVFVVLAAWKLGLVPQSLVHTLLSPHFSCGQRIVNAVRL